MKKEWIMEILTALQWAKKGFIPNEGTEGTEQWTNCYSVSYTHLTLPTKRIV